MTREVIEEVTRAFPDNPGDLSQFRLAVTHEDAADQFEWFCQVALPSFGTFQDALVEESPWVFHSLISMYLNCGLLAPLVVCQRVENAWRDGHCSLAAAEGFIRQVLGWREYVRGIYWLHMPEYAQRNTFSATRPLPEFFWTAKTDLRCLQVALSQSLDLGYAHHIQRLMVIGNFALLAGLDVKAVCEWYLAVYVDAYEWVELPIPRAWPCMPTMERWPASPMQPAVSIFRSKEIIVSNAAITPVKSPVKRPVHTTVCTGTLLIGTRMCSKPMLEWDLY